MNPVDVQRLVAEDFGISRKAMVGGGRRRYPALARAVAQYLMRQAIPVMSLQDIADMFGGQHHTTVLQAIRRIAAAMEANPGFKAQVDRLLSRLRGQRDAQG